MRGWVNKSMIFEFIAFHLEKQLCSNKQPFVFIHGNTELAPKTPRSKDQQQMTNNKTIHPISTKYNTYYLT